MQTLHALSSSAFALMMLVPACATDHTHDDAGPPPPDAVVCGEVTPVARFDALMPRILAALAQHPSFFPSPRAAYDDNLAYVRARVASGAVVIDATRIDACLERLATFGRADATFIVSPCPDVFRPRCPAPTGSRCGTDIDCELSDFCDARSGDGSCERSGHCAPRIPLGGACDDGVCAWPDVGAVTCARHLCVAVTVRQATTVGSPCEQLVAGEGGVSSILQECAAPLACVLTGDQFSYALACDTPTVPGTVAEGRSCTAPSDCVTGTTCTFVGQTCMPVPSTCSDPSGCPEGFGCVGGACTATDGSAGAPCGESAFHSDCAIGLACGSDFRCGPLLPDGATVDVTTPGECASMCTSGGITNPRCVPLPP